jgi:hypothetical protein
MRFGEKKYAYAYFVTQEGLDEGDLETCDFCGKWSVSRGDHPEGDIVCGGQTAFDRMCESHYDNGDLDVYCDECGEKYERNVPEGEACECPNCGAWN